MAVRNVTVVFNQEGKTALICHACFTVHVVYVQRPDPRTKVGYQVVHPVGKHFEDEMLLESFSLFTMSNHFQGFLAAENGTFDRLLLTSELDGWEAAGPLPGQSTPFRCDVDRPRLARFIRNFEFGRVGV